MKIQLKIDVQVPSDELHLHCREITDEVRQVVDKLQLHKIYGKNSEGDSVMASLSSVIYTVTTVIYSFCMLMDGARMQAGQYLMLFGMFVVCATLSGCYFIYAASLWISFRKFSGRCFVYYCDFYHMFCNFFCFDAAICKETGKRF